MIGQPSTAAPRSVLHNTDFVRLWIGQSVSQLGTQVSVLAIPITAAVFLAATPFDMSLLATLGMLPVLLFGLIAGAWIDRMGKRKVLIAADLTRLFVLGLVPVLYLSGQLALWHLWIVAFVLGTATIFFDIAYLAYLPRLVEGPQLVDANSKLELTRSSASVVGPGVAGALIAILYAPLVVLLDAVSYGASALAVMTIGSRETKSPTPSARRRLLTEIGEGLHFVWGHALLRPLALATATSNLFSSMGFALYYLFVLHELELTPAGIGVVFAVGNAGLVIASLTAARVTRRIGLGRVLVSTLVGAAACALLVPLATPLLAIPLLMASKFGGAICTVIYNVNQVSLRQAITPPQLQGRVNGAVRFIVWGSQPVGFLLGGVLGSAIGLRPAFLIASLCMFAAVPLLWFSVVARLRDAPTGPASLAVPAGS